MTGALTLELQALARPEVLEILAELGQDVTVSVFGQPPVTVRAVLYQLEDKSSLGPSLTDPKWKVLAWQGVFAHDAPLRQVGYIVTDSTGRQFVPEADAEDPAEQGVALIVRLCPLPERTRLQQLSFAVQGGLTTDPGTGNVIPGQRVPLTVPARLAHTNDPHVVQLVGADGASTAVIGRWGTLADPLPTPPTLHYGAQCPLLVDGQPGILTVLLAWPDEDTATEAQFGARWVGIWRLKKG